MKVELQILPIIRFEFFKKIINLFFVIYNFSIINMFTLFSVLGLITYPDDNWVIYIKY